MQEYYILKICIKVIFGYTILDLRTVFATNFFQLLTGVLLLFSFISDNSLQTGSTLNALYCEER